MTSSYRKLPSNSSPKKAPVFCVSRTNPRLRNHLRRREVYGEGSDATYLHSSDNLKPNLTHSILKSSDQVTNMGSLQPKLKGMVNFEKSTSRASAYNSYQLPTERLAKGKPIKDDAIMINTSTASFSHLSMSNMLTHSIDFSKQSARFKQKRLKNGGVRVLTLYTPNYDAICKKTTGTIDFGKIEGRENQTKRPKFAFKVQLSEGVKQLMLEKASKLDRQQKNLGSSTNRV